MSRTPGRLRWCLVAALLAAGAACGLSENSDPRAIAANDLPPGLIDETPSSSTTVADTPSTATINVYYLALQNGVTRLVAVPRDVTDASRAKDRLEALLAPPSPEEQAAGITTSIPADTVLLGTELIEADRELVIDLSRSLFDIQGEELRNAFAQLVWTATQLEGVRQVRFLVDGEEYRVPDEAGIEQPGAVRQADYDSLSPFPS